MRKCSCCHYWYDLLDFGKDKHRKDGKNVYCRKCVREKSKANSHLRKKRIYNPEKAAKYRSSLNEDRKKKIAIDKRKSFLLNTYGISLQQYDEMIKNQGYKCAICERPALSLKKTLAVDHNHDTGKVRGLVCAPCNRTLGYLKIDTTDRFAQNIVDYIKRYL